MKLPGHAKKQHHSITHGHTSRTVRGQKMPCTKCDGDTKVVDTLFHLDNTTIVRRRNCVSKRCGHQFHTEERVLP